MIEIKDIEKLALLGRITVPDSEKEKMAKDINKILEYVGQISEARASIVGSTSSSNSNSVHGGGGGENLGAVRNVLREDINPHESGIYTEKLLAAAPKTEKNYVKVKKIL